MPPNILVLGAGVSGLTTALHLARSNPNYSITVVAKHMPGDYDIEYASPWAGANWMPVGKPGSDHARYEAETWPELARLAGSVPGAGVHFQECAIYRRDKDAATAVGDWTSELVKEDPWFRDVAPNFRILPKTELPPGMDGGTSFTSVCINTALYLPYLASQCLAHGVILRRGIATSVTSAASLHHSNRPADVVVNCTGLASLHLPGVRDSALYPARGQIVIVRNDPGIMASTSGTDDGDDEAAYVMHRAAGGGCVLGGCLQTGNWDGETDLALAGRIMRRAVELCPKLVRPGEGVEGLSVVRHGVGLRPMRKGGMRVEREAVRGEDGRKVEVVHNYGHGGYGYQTSWGIAFVVERLVGEALGGRARL